MDKHFAFDYYDPNHDGLDDWLRDHDISCDDYDYAIFSECLNKDQMAIQRVMKEHLLNGACSNDCHYVEDFFGKNGVLGIAYHS